MAFLFSTRFSLLLKPVEYNLVESRLTQSAEQNLRIISTIFIYMLRRLWGQSNKPMVRNYKFNLRLKLCREISPFEKHSLGNSTNLVNLLLRFRLSELNYPEVITSQDNISIFPTLLRNIQ